MILIYFENFPLYKSPSLYIVFVDIRISRNVKKVNRSVTKSVDTIRDICSEDKAIEKGGKDG